MNKTIFLSSILLLLAGLLTNRAFAQDQKALDDAKLKAYFKEHNIKATKTASGLYYVISKQGSGDNAKAGQSASMKYIGKFLDGKIFDANVDAAGEYVNGRSPLNFNVGEGQVISGWDEGVQLLNPGTKATLYLPSTLAYGAYDRGPIPANSILVFDVELLSTGN